MSKPNAQPLNLHEGVYNASMASREWVAHTPAAVDIGRAPRGVMTDTDGTVTMEDVNGTSIVVDFTAWVEQPKSPTRITTTTATTVYLLY